MPFTPFHMGPGILMKALLQSSFSLMVFGWSQILMDLQPLVALLSHQGRVHGFTHTYLGATFIAIVAAITGKYLAQWALQFVLNLPPPMIIRWWVAFLSAFIGTYSHVILDSIMHADMQPLFPFSFANGFLGAISLESLHRACILSGIVGGIAYFVIGKLVSKRRGSMNHHGNSAP